MPGGQGGSRVKHGMTGGGGGGGWRRLLPEATMRIRQRYAGGAGVSKKKPNWRQQEAWGDRGGGRANIKNQNAKTERKNQNVGKRESGKMQGKRWVPCQAPDDGRGTI
jgi:hypothetical protein